TYRGDAYDMLVASGGQVAIALLAMAFEKRGYRAVPLLAHQLGIRTDSLFSQARIQSVDSEKLLGYVKEGIVPIVAGFQGVSPEERITTLGRGGSDTTAVALAAAIEATECEIYTDVPAVFSADPRLVPKAHEIPKLSFAEMMEMACLGSKVLHFRCVELAAKYGVKIHVRSTFETREGTWVVPEEEIMEQSVVSAITHDGSTAVLKAFPVPEGPAYLAQLFSELADRGVVVDVITQSYNEEGQRLAFSVNESDLFLAEEVVRKSVGEKVKITVMQNMVKISTVGVGMKANHGVAARFFKTLADHDIDVHLVTTSDIKISAIIDKKNLEKAANGLHSAFSLDVD
ncbi:MAG: aspartate kinase, partial [Bdellovibrionales bacterium]|nr:aspartate kinase [Bdellovibrionales bacterium]